MEKHTSKLNNTPPIGAPKATEIPAAAAADKASRFIARYVKYWNEIKAITNLTFISIQIVERFHYNVRTTTSDMDQRTFFANPHTGRNS